MLSFQNPYTSAFDQLQELMILVASGPLRLSAEYVGELSAQRDPPPSNDFKGSEGLLLEWRKAYRVRGGA